MRFGVGLLFSSAPQEPFVLDPVADLLHKIDLKSSTIRGDQKLTLVPFVRNKDMVASSHSLAGTGTHALDAVSLDEAGVTFGELNGFANVQHPSYNEQLDFDLGLRVVLSRCHVIVIVCHDADEVSDVGARLARYQNTYALIALVAVRGGATMFLEVDPLPKQLDGPSWLLKVVERWEIVKSGPGRLPDRKMTILGFIFPFLSSVIIGRRIETVKKKKRTELERCRDGMGLSATANKLLEPADRKLLEAVVDDICPYFSRHDDLGRHYSNVFRTTCLLVPLLVVISTVLAVAAGFDTARHDLWHVCEGILLSLAGSLFLRSRLAEHHRKWVENRLLTELLRPIVLNTVFFTAPSLAPPSEEPRLWVERTRLVLRHVRGLPAVAFTTPKDHLLSARISAIADFATYQAEWHKDFANQHRTAEKRLARMSTYAFMLTLGLCVFQLVFAYYPQAGVATSHLLTMLTLCAASTAFVVLLLSHQLGFEAIAERSTNAAEHFETLTRAISVGAPSADARQAYSWAEECANAILAEQHSWYRQIPLIRMHL